MNSRPFRLRALPRLFGALVLLLQVGILAGPLAAQQEEGGGQARDTLVVPERRQPLDEVPDLPDVDRPASPGGAFLRSVLIPGWGHAAIGSYNRGGFYFAAQGSTVWMLVRTALRLSEARDVRTFRASIVEERLAEDGVENPADIADALDEDEGVQAARALVRSRDQQFEDWLALAIFLSFLGGADAFVSAHLADFPEPVRIGIRPVGDRVEVGLSVAIPPIR